MKREKASLLVSLAEELLDVVESRTVITYRDLSRRFGDKYGENYHPRFWSKPLGDVSKLCMKNSLPPISAVVVNSETGFPGRGFFELLEKHLIGAPVPMNQWEAFWQEQVAKVYACDQWEKLPKLVAEAVRKDKH